MQRDCLAGVGAYSNSGGEMDKPSPGVVEAALGP